MRRWTLRILLCLLLGAITTIAVAWLLAILPTPRQPGPHVRNFHSVANGIHWSAARDSGLGWEWVASSRDRQYLDTDGLGNSTPQEVVPRWTGFSEPTDEFVTGTVTHEALQAEARGWPMLALAHEVNFAASQNTGAPALRFGAPSVTIRHDWTRAIPLRPIWPGFVLNTMLFAGVWLSLICLAVTSRRYYRRRRGLCVNCGYDLRGEFARGCPECGWNREESEPRA